ncbi:MAG: ABC transporter permease [Gemmobacter sp.]|jgi:osmoprotectant transport system permease protein|nr:ABC transporter permease [Gemmobacter sp.]
MSFQQYFDIFGDQIIRLTIRHILLFLIAFAAAALLGVVMGIAIYRVRVLRFLLPIVNILQTVPEIVLLALAIPFLGIGYTGALVPLLVKGILPVLQNTAGGLQSVRPELKEAATGIGMSKAQLLFRVELPSALPIILAGMRISAIMLVSVITLTAYIGVESLGTLILQGISRMDSNPLIVGSGLSALLAVLVNQIMIFLERRALRRTGGRP